MVSGDKSTSIQYINNLRILAIFAVITAHVAIWTAINTKPLTFNWWFSNWIHFACLWCIPVFVMISGALLLDDSRNETTMCFYKKRMRRIGVPLVFWSFFYLVVRKVVGHEELTVRYVIKLILTAEPYYHLWFLYMIVGLYLITPMLRTYIRHSSTKERIFLIVIIFTLASSYSLIDILFWSNQRSIFTMFVPYIGYYLCGYQLRFIDPRKIPSRYLVAALIFCAIYIAMLTGVFVEMQGQINGRCVFDFFSPPVIVMSIAIFWAAYLIDRNAKPQKGILKTVVAWIASTTLGIYVLHFIILEYVGDKLGKYAADDNVLVGIIIVPVIAFIVCCLTTSLIMRVPFLRRIVC